MPPHIMSSRRPPMTRSAPDLPSPVGMGMERRRSSSSEIQSGCADMVPLDYIRDEHLLSTHHNNSRSSHSHSHTHSHHHNNTTTTTMSPSQHRQFLSAGLSSPRGNRNRGRLSGFGSNGSSHSCHSPRLSSPFLGGGGSGSGSGSSSSSSGRKSPSNGSINGGNSKSNRCGCRMMSLMMMLVVAAVALMGALGYAWTTYSQNVLEERIRQDLAREEMALVSEYEVQMAKLQTQNDDLRQKVARATELQDHHDQLKTQLNGLADLEGQMHTLQRERDHAHQVRDEAVRQTEHLTITATALQHNIQHMSRRALVETFGAGPHRVEITLQFTPNFPKLTEDENEWGRILIEMAPVDVMPHAVYWFLEQVRRQLYDGTSFHGNAPHILLAGPEPSFLNIPDVNLHQRFVDAGFSSLFFQEYSEHFPHQQYTLGYAGRPAGPHFYINMRDNTQDHGPGGQQGRGTHEADPCFAKVVDGFDVLERMQQSPIRDGGHMSMAENVAIVSMRIV